jgi:hypothetical protein
MRFRKGDVPLATLEDWRRLGGPKKAEHWVDGRSAKEAARAWLGDGVGHMPTEVLAVLEQHHAFGPVTDWEAEPEARLPFDSFDGEPRNTDLLVLARDQHGSYLIAVEAKADEAFSATVADTLVAATERYLKSDRSKGVARLLQLGQAILGPRQESEPEIGLLRYQLLTATAGALCEGKRRECLRVLLLVHEFVTDRTDDALHNRNAQDLNLFVGRLSHGRVSGVGYNEIQGSFDVPGAPLCLNAPALYIGKVRRVLRTESP